MKKNSLVLGLSILSFAATGQTTWVVDPVHSSVQFEVSHLAVSSVTGDFTGFTGSVITQNDDFNNARISATIDVNSVDTNNLERDKHLKEDDFFNASKYPNITFVSSVFSKEKDNIFTIQGDLTIRDVTKPISLSAEYGGIVSINGQQKAGFTAEGTIDRFDYGLKWDDVLDSGGLIVGEKVDIILKVQLVKKQ
ncbi:MAG: YceI family protein [Cytophagales bacterium]|nr:YceI family protein [Cytophagales bacterium]